MQHQPVLVKEFLEVFASSHLTVFVDGTVGAGGHAKAILDAHPEIERFIGIDQDPDALKLANERLAPYREKVTLLRGNFSDVTPLLQSTGLSKADGMLVDIGVSSMQLDRPERGFSFMREGPLDMRMDPSGHLTAADIVNTWEEHEIGKLFRDYGEEKQWRRAARAIVERRKTAPFTSTTDLAACLASAIKLPYGAKIHPATLAFQGLRIAVNQELDRLQKFLKEGFSCLNPSGRLAVITFHSLEDRIVKERFAYYASDKESTSGIGGMFLDKKPEAQLVMRKPVGPSLEEIEQNPRSRSAKLRAVEKL